MKLLFVGILCCAVSAPVQATSVESVEKSESTVQPASDQPAEEYTGPLMTAVLVEALDDRFTVEVYVSNVADLRAYQVSSAVSGGEAGHLTVEDAWIETDRDDYVFASRGAIDAADLTGARLLGALFSGGTAESNSAGRYAAAPLLGTDSFPDEPLARGHVGG